VTGKLSSRVKHLNIQSIAIRRGSMKILAQVKSPKLSPKNQLSSWRRVDSQKSMVPLVSSKRSMTLLRAQKIAVREERSYCPALVKQRMVSSCLITISLFSNLILQELFIWDFNLAGNILRIKIKREQYSPRGVLEQPSVKQMGFGSSQLSNPNSTQQQNKVVVKPAAVAHQRISVEPQASTHFPFKFMRKDAPPMAKVVLQTESKLSVKPPAGRVGQHARVDPPPAKLAQRNLPGKAPPAKVLQRVDSQVPSGQPPAYPKILQEASTPIRHPENLQSRAQSLKEAPGMNQLQRPVASVSKEEPSSSGMKAEAVKGQEAKQSKSDRKKSRKAEKKEKKFRDLFVTWIPPSLEMENSDAAQDWLFGSTRNSDACMTSCRASDGSVLFPLMEQQPCLQPRAAFLPDLSIYQLPYVVPF
jgi:hypothetical protein